MGRPSFMGLGDSLDGIKEKLIPSKAQLKSYGWATAGGAAGFVGSSFVSPKLSEWIAKVPGLDGYASEISQGLVGIVGAGLAWDWNSDFSKGMVGGLAGHAVARAVSKLTGVSMGSLAASPEDVMLAAAPSDQLPMPSDRMLLEGMGEVEPEPSFAGLDGTVEEQANLGSWLS